jgi:hydroxypyruvate isomerase
MKLAANISLLYTELPMLERIAAAARDGFEGVEVLFPYDVEPAVLRQGLDDAGLPLVLINTPLGAAGALGLAAVAGAEPLFREALQRALDVASATACPSIHVMAGRPTEAGWQGTLIDNLRWAATLASERGIVLTLEPLNHLDMPGYAYQRPAQVVALLQQIDQPNVRLQFDLFHVAREGLDAVQELAAFSPWIHHVQIADAPDRTQPDLAKPEVRRPLTALVALPYTGWLGLEYKPQGATAGSLAWREPLRELIATAPVSPLRS